MVHRSSYTLGGCGQIAVSCCVLFYKACRILNSKLKRAVSRKYVQRKTFPCTYTWTHIIYTHNLPKHVYEYILFISIDGFVRKYNHTRAYKNIYVLHFS
jgi:hypothetical protein